MVKLIFWIFVLILVASFFGISLQAVITSPAGQANFGYVFTLIGQFFHWALSFVGM